MFHGPRAREIALTFDDGFCARCVARLVRDVERTGAHVTFFPNGVYGRSWDPQARAIRRLIARGQVAIGNHTYTHSDAVTESPAALEEDLARNEAWIQRTFGVTARPFFRPPYGAYDASVGAVAGQLGYTKVILWSGTLADSSLRSIPYVIHAINYWARPGAIILGHGNYPATSVALPRMLTILRHRDLHAELIVLPEIGSVGAHRRELAAAAREAIATALEAPLEAAQPG